MKDGFLKVAALTPKVEIANPLANAKTCAELVKAEENKSASLFVLPELSLTAYSCGDLFLQPFLTEQAMRGLEVFCKETAEVDGLICIGLPYALEGKLYDVAALLCKGKLLGLVPKRTLQANEARYFAPAPMENRLVSLLGQEVLFGCNQVFCCDTLPECSVFVELGQDLNNPDDLAALSGASILCNLSADAEFVGKRQGRIGAVKAKSARLLCGYVLANAGVGESTTDLVFGGHNLVAESGRILAESKPFTQKGAITELDLKHLIHNRAVCTTYCAADADAFDRVSFSLPLKETALTRRFRRLAFIPEDETERAERCEEILAIQTEGLARRLEHIHGKSAVIGLSGGLDSTLALLVIARAFDQLGLPRNQILAVTMPGFGTTDRTYQNALTLAKGLGAELKEISIVPSVLQHFKDIAQDADNHDVTFENAQARERTQILMDLANQRGGLVVGTGDLSELALGWATYNGDHMSMYGVNGSVPKTLVRHLVAYEAAHSADEAVKKALIDVLETPVSPELLPAVDGHISQKTEELVGPYELHDFFLHAFLRYGDTPAKIFRLAKLAFGGDYNDATLRRWLINFFRRFFTQQFKRSCMPDGPKVGKIDLSPRGDLLLPSDASAALWLAAAEAIEIKE